MFHMKVFRDGVHRMMLYCPEEEKRIPFKRHALFLMADSMDAARVEPLLEQLSLIELAEENEIILAVPCVDSWQGKDCAFFEPFRSGADRPTDDPWPVNEQGIPLLEAMLQSWHPMPDTHYAIGLGSGADYMLKLAAQKPEWFAAVWAVGGTMPPDLSPCGVMPIWLSNVSSEVREAFCTANGTDRQENEVYTCSRNPVQRVISDAGEADAAMVHRVWKELFSKVRRVNTCPRGDVDLRIRSSRETMTCFIEDDRIDGTPHTWFVHAPEPRYTGELFSLVLCFHGGSDNPEEAAEGIRLHELGEQERIISVYPWATNRCSWNSAMEPDLPDDTGFVRALILHMLAHDPVDPRRIYLTGFSNGAAMAQTGALLNPDLVAAIFHIDSNWPGRRGAYQEIDWHDVIPFARGMEKKQNYDYRIPVWYTYGSRELSFPVKKGSSQQHQYDFWKMYNGIPIRPTPAAGEKGDSDCGVMGDKHEVWYPCAAHPDQWYDVHRFFTPEGLNLYNYVAMHDKGHEAAPMDAYLGWFYAKQFRREASGALSIAATGDANVPQR